MADYFGLILLVIVMVILMGGFAVMAIRRRRGTPKETGGLDDRDPSGR